MLPMTYGHEAYALSLAEFGLPAELPQSQGWYLQREIPGSPHRDGIGCYPYLSCRRWKLLADDLEQVSDRLVSFSAVPDPFGDHGIVDLTRAFPDRLIRFKDHFIADLTRPRDEIVAVTHRRQAEKALKRVDVEFRERPLELLDEWMVLFGQTIERFEIRGLPGYSRSAFARQFSMPGVFMSVARHGGEMVAAHLQFINGDVAYAHLAAGSPAGRSLGADYALYYSEIAYFSARTGWLDWGGAAGATDVGNGGLERFKRGWSTGTKPVYFGGRILDPVRYGQLAAERAVGAKDYFPSYRAGEFR